MLKRLGACILAVTLMAAASPAAAAKIPAVGEVAPDFRALMTDGKKVTLADFKGQVLILNFWATWCGPCKTELPLLDTYYKVQRANGLRVLAVGTENSLPVEQMEPLAKALQIPLVWHMGGPYRAIDGAVPTNFVIDRHGVVRYATAGAFSLDELNAVIVPLLQEPADAPRPAAVAAAR